MGFPNGLSYHNVHCEITKELFIFCLDRKKVIPKPLNIILLYAKYYIYITRCNQRTLYLAVFKKKFLLLFKTLKEISLSNNQLTEFDAEWSVYDTLLDDIISQQ